MTSKFEQLIEYVINDEEAKAKELFHDIVVEKSREIYENLMDESEELDEESGDEKRDVKRDDRAKRDAEEVDKHLRYDFKHGRKVKEDEETDLDEGEEELDEMMGDELSDEVEMEEEGINMEDDSDADFDNKAEHDGEELTHDIEADHDEGDIEDRVVDLEDKLDELMAEFESLMGGQEHGDSVSDMDGGDALEMDDTDTAEFGNDMDEMSMMENVKLDAAPKPVTTEPAGTNTKSTVAFNSGATGMQGAPVKMTGDTAQGRAAPKSGDLPEAGQFKNVPGKGGSNAKLASAPKPVTAQAAGVNTRTPFPKG
jgi:hypothetical protein